MSREELAFRAGVSMKTIERLEGENPPAPIRATQTVIASVLKVDPVQIWPLEEAA